MDLLSREPWLFLSLCTFVGLLVGSFLNVVIHRLPLMLERQWQRDCKELLSQSTEEPDDSKFNLITPRSRCPQCQVMVSAGDNIPVISWIWLRGKCRHCDTRISIQYPLFEIMCAAMTFAVAFNFSVSFEAIWAIAFTWALIALSGIDLNTKLLPDDITLPLIWLGLACNMFGLITDLHSAVLGAMAGYLILWLVYQAFRITTGKEGMGYGDFKLLAAIGAWLGWQHLPMVILLSSLIGAIVGITLIIVMGRDRNIPIPFGPYLAGAGWVSLIWGHQISEFYQGIIGA
ncbi:MAG: A24 family peptidase [Pseudomonadota bacterium]